MNDVGLLQQCVPAEDPALSTAAGRHARRSTPAAADAEATGNQRLLTHALRPREQRVISRASEEKITLAKPDLWADHRTLAGAPAPAGLPRRSWW